MDKNDRVYSNGEINVYWKPSLCIHATHCFVELPEVFDPSSRPWIDMKGANTKRIIEQVDRCPTDALTYEIIEKATDVKESTNINKAKVKIFKDGPICVSGDIEIINEDGSITVKKGTVSFCRCNLSSKMPYCDGSHIHSMK